MKRDYKNPTQEIVNTITAMLDIEPSFDPMLGVYQWMKFPDDDAVRFDDSFRGAATVALTAGELQVDPGTNRYWQDQLFTYAIKHHVPMLLCKADDFM